MATLPIVERLPLEHLSLIGEVITVWAIQEHELRQVAYLLLRLDPKRGRLAVKTLRAKDAVDLIADLLNLADYKSKTTKFKEFSEILEEIESRRNTLAHNLWLQGDDGTLFVQSLTGSWPASKGQHRKRRRVDPAGIPLPADSLRDLIQAMRQTISQTRKLKVEVIGVVGSPVSALSGNE